MIRVATVHDVPRICEIINAHAERGRMLFKSYAQLYEDLRDFAVVERDGEIVGCCALTIIWADLAEVRSLAVDAKFMGKGIGRELVEWSVDEARRLQIRRLFALTYEQGFFAKLGFEVVEKDTLPLKVWSDCVRCPKRDGCDEIAVVRTLEDVIAPELPVAPPTPRGVSIPVLPDIAD
jgi:amino-acid N-acetyltransferase